MMNSLPTRLLCAVLSIAMATGLVAFSAPVVSLSGPVAQPRGTVIATVSAAPSPQG